MKKLILSFLVAFLSMNSAAFADNFIYYPQQIVCKNHSCEIPPGFTLSSLPSYKDGIFKLVWITASLNGKNSAEYSFGIPGFGIQYIFLEGPKMYPAIKQPSVGWFINSNEVYQCMNIASTCPLTTQR